MRIIFTLFFLITLHFLPAQQPAKPFTSASNALKNNSVFVTAYEMPDARAGRKVVALETPFAKAEFISPLLAAIAKGKVIEKVQLIYTTFAVSASFDQQTLNQQRLTNLFAVLPDAFLNPMTEWELVGQKGAHSPEEGRNYFHGFVITWRPEASTSLLKTEMSMLDSLFFTKPSGDKRDPLKTETVKDPSTEKLRMITHPDGSTTIISRDIPEDSLWRYMRPSGEGFSVVYAKWGDTAHTVVIVDERTENGTKRKRTWKLDDHFSDKPLTGIDLKLNDPDSVVTTVLRRNLWPSMVLVADLTGSMSPYTAQVLAWVPKGLADGRCAGFVFFNDGDQKSTNQKDVGKTGGIYSTRAQSRDSVYSKMKETMSKGDGGDLPENPVEATIFSINRFNPQTEIILIADNFSAPRDLELYAKITRPVHIILCGARGTVNPDYLFLARQTHGTVHTLHDDITTLDKMQDGEIITIESKEYLLKNEHFICLNTFSPYR